MTATISENIAAVRQEIAAHTARQNVTLIAVTKNHDTAAVQAAIAAGVTDIGENRVQEAKAKFAALADDPSFCRVRRHLIGHLQTNKVKDAVKLFDVIQSVDSLHLLTAVDKAAAAAGKRQNILLQVNLAEEPQKSGARVADLPEIAAAAKNLPYIKLCGLMFIAPNLTNVEECRPLFKAMRELFASWQNKCGEDFTELSMGMSGDFTIAVEEGATMVRVGTAIFGARDYGKRG